MTGDVPFSFYRFLQYVKSDRVTCYSLNFPWKKLDLAVSLVDIKLLNNPDPARILRKESC